MLCQPGLGGPDQLWLRSAGAITIHGFSLRDGALLIDQQTFRPAANAPGPCVP